MKHTLDIKTFINLKIELGGKNYDTYDENKQLDSRRVQRLV